MLEAILKALWSKLTQDSNLAGRLSQYPSAGGNPAIFMGFAPSGAKMPYMVIRSDSATPEETDATERMIFALDSFVSGNSAAPILGIRQRVEYLLTQPVSAAGIPILGIFREFGGLVPEPEDGVQHLHQRFIVRYGRGDLYS